MTPPRIGPAVVLAAALAATVGTVACSEEPAGTVEEPSVFEGGAEQVMFEVDHYLTREGIRQGRVTADTAMTYEDGSRIELRRLEIRFYDEAGNDRGVLVSDAGDYDLPSGNMVARGEVDLRGRLDGPVPSILETDSLVYDAAADELSTDAAWTLTRPDGTVERGRGLVTDPALQRIEASDWEVTTPDVEVPE